MISVNRNWIGEDEGEEGTVTRLCGGIHPAAPHLAPSLCHFQAHKKILSDFFFFKVGLSFPHLQTIILYPVELVPLGRLSCVTLGSICTS